ncbi:uncharacterized protein LOC119733711 [Patiria miniata]|uniref:Uncharacterized protein n=1 Tax=Patiria miniata TaxID=46514 RepID=A0A914AH51_PATMI|nr:uncharacterized protein LOC119733711 [Patiria miniata]
MRWGRTWWRGKVLAYESASQEASDESETFRDVDVTSEQDSSDSQVIGELSDSDLDEMDDIPLTQLQTHLASTQKPLHETDGNGKVNVTDSEEMDDMSLMQLQTHLARTNKSMTSSEAAVCPPSQTAQDLNANKTTTPTELAATAIPNATTPTKEAGEHQESQMMNISEQCSEFHCLQDIFAACAQCQCLLCFEHFIRSDACSNHNKYFSVYVDNMSSSVIDNSPCFVEVGATDNTLIQDEVLTTVDVGMNIDCVSDPSQKQPEDYVVDGEERVETGFSANVQPSGTKARNKNFTFKRNQGESYYTEKTNCVLDGHPPISGAVQCLSYTNYRSIV